MSEEIKCCLCFRCLTDSTSRKKRKRLHSDTCSHSKQVLEQLLRSTRSATLSDFVETKSSDAYLCYQCDGKAASLHKLQQRVSEVQNELLDKLKELHEFMTTGPRKRLYVNVQNSADKHPRLDSQCDQPMMSETELHNSVQSESDQQLQSPMIKSKSPALSVSIIIVKTATLFFY